ncbi:MAG: LamG domain-containing protein [Bacteroidetes bacterium]|nr:LamG domain-containing protein [Bacteroidota bacterium]
MKSRLLNTCRYIFMAAFIGLLAMGHLKSQTTSIDSLYLPPIKITSLNGYGPFVLGSERSNLFIIFELPKNTSEVIMKMIDSKGVQINRTHTETGSNLQTVTWSFESDTMGFPLSPQLSITVHYDNDSIAIYNIPYTIYPDTVTMNAVKGYGPFMTNDYPFSDTLWHPVLQQLNTFTIKHLPPRTDTIEFQVMTIDSVIVLSKMVTAPPGSYLDSAVYQNVRMDLLPLDTKYLRVFLWCQGGPDKGLAYHKDLSIIPQRPKLKCISDSLVRTDSIGVFVQNQLSGQALAVDSVKYALIQNGPGLRSLDRHFKTIYPGPYSIDFMQSSFSIEAWMNFNLTGLTGDVTYMNLITVDSLWQLYAEANTSGVAFFFSTSAGSLSNDLWSVSLLPSQLNGTGWHHIAFTCYYNNSGGYPYGRFYLDGQQLSGVSFNEPNYDYIFTYIDWRRNAGTQPLRLGGNDPASYSLVTAMDEVRIWSRTLSDADIWYNYMKSPLQEYELEGYWNFDDLRNRLNYISDRSYNNNFGYLKNKASFIHQFPGIQRTIDTLKILSSAMNTDSVKYLFVDRNNVIIDSCTKLTTGGKTSLGYDVASLPDNIIKLKIMEYYHPSTGIPLETDYNLYSLAPEPIATPQYNWNTYYSTPTSMGKTYAPVTVSGLPGNTSKVLLGLKNGNEVFDTMSYSSTSIPFHHSLTLNGTDNFIQTSQEITSPQNFSIMFWVKTATGSGGKIIGFCDNQAGSTSSSHDREIIMENDGSLRFNILEGTTMKTLYALNINNDGNWHHVAVTVDNNPNASIYVDGSLAQRLTLSSLSTYQGWWIIGRNGATKNKNIESVAEYFSGSVSEISVWNRALDYIDINTFRFQSAVNADQVLYYKFNEGSGTTVIDLKGSNNGTIIGSAPAWYISNEISDIVWNNNMVALQPGTYTFFANVSYPGAPASGASYSLGNFIVAQPFPGCTFNFNLSEGQGYFNQGISLINSLSVESNYTGSGNSGWSKNYVKYNFLTFDHVQISSDSATYTSSSWSGQFEIDMGDAPPGSYISLETGYYTTSSQEIFVTSVSIPIYIHPMIPPTVNGNFGPFDQAIAPGSMQHLNTFSIVTEPLSDLDSIVAVFYDGTNTLIGRCDAVKVSDTLWTATYDMSLLSPPLTTMNMEYYLGQDTHPAAIEGPFPITIHKTKPTWFDFIPAANFSNVQQSGTIVTFTVTTPFEKNWLINNFIGVQIPSWVPLMGGTQSTMNSPTASAYLQYDFSSHTLELNQAPEFYQEYTKLGVGNSSLALFSFNTSQNNFYEIDAQNNLIASQNFTIGGGVSTDVLVINNIAKQIGNLLNMSSVVDPASIVVKPSFKLSVTAAFEYASRLHLMVDTLTGKWGSFGNLNVDANPNHTQAYMNSASYHFYSGSFGIEFSVGAEFLEGLAAGYFGIDGRVALGYGHSYVTIPSVNTKILESAAFQVYGRFYIDLLWGWYEKNVWGPKMFYSTNFWGDDMSHCFPPIGKKSQLNDNLVANSTWPGLADEIVPVNGFTKMAQPYPHQSVGSSDENIVYTWIENGKRYGERSVKLAYMLKNVKRFSDYISIELNNHAVNSPVSDAITDNQVLLCWAQTRYDNKTILGIKQSDVLKEFIKAQDIWYAVYDVPNKKVVQLNMISDDTVSLTSGRAEGNPLIVTLSESKALIVWKVADLDNHTSGIWYVKLEKQKGNWSASEPALITDMIGVKTQLSVAVPEDDKAIIAWMNTTGDKHDDKKLMTSEYDGNNWTTPNELIAMEENQICNYFDMKFNHDRGAVAVATYINDPSVNNYEKLILIPWDYKSKKWNKQKSTDLLIEPLAHLQLPRIAINDDGKATIAVKVEKIVRKSAGQKISQVDLLTGNLNDPFGSWKHIAGNAFVCDTSKQVAEIALTYINTDTLMILTNEFPMLASNARFNPVNGVMFGDRDMNLVLRCFAIDQDSIVKDVAESPYFIGINEPEVPEETSALFQNYPNPCKDFTVVKFDISTHSYARLELFDFMGNRIATLIDQELSQGSYEIKLNVSLLKPGTYSCRLTVGSRADAIKIIVIN